MGRIGLAFRAFFSALRGELTAERLQTALTHPLPSATPTPQGKRDQLGRSDAVTLLSALQREARFVDLVEEPLDEYSDEQIGAAARDVLRDCQIVLVRMFALRPVIEEAEQSEVETPSKFSHGRIRIRGKVASDPPFRGTLVHPGWEVSHCELPMWTGEAADESIVAPAEIQL